MATCPICGRTGLDATLQECPQCNADLVCFQLLAELHDAETWRKIHLSRDTAHDTGASATKATAQNGSWPPISRRVGIFVSVFLLVGSIAASLLFYKYNGQQNLNQETVRSSRGAERIKCRRKLLNMEQPLANILTCQLGPLPPGQLPTNGKSLLLRSSRRLTRTSTDTVALD